jgi:hypothetical protein
MEKKNKESDTNFRPVTVFVNILTNFTKTTEVTITILFCMKLNFCVSNGQLIEKQSALYASSYLTLTHP